MKSQRNRKVMTVALTLLILTGIPMTLAGLNRLWTRELTRKTFIWNRMDFEGFICNTWDDMQAQNEVMELGTNNEIWITVIETDYENSMKLDIIYTSDASEVIITAEGQFLQLWTEAGGEKVTNPSNGPFPIPTDGTAFSIDLSEKMMWKDPAIIGTGNICELLQITFHVDTSEMTEADGTFYYDISLGMGIEETS